jgi:hypothetical protein
MCQMMGIYSDSPAIVSIPLQSAEAKVRVDSQLRAIARGFHLHPSPWALMLSTRSCLTPNCIPHGAYETRAIHCASHANPFVPG